SALPHPVCPRRSDYRTSPPEGSQFTRPVGLSRPTRPTSDHAGRVAATSGAWGSPLGLRAGATWSPRGALNRPEIFGGSAGAPEQAEQHPYRSGGEHAHDGPKLYASSPLIKLPGGAALI